MTTIPSAPETPPPKPPSSEKTTTSKSKLKAGERDWERFSFVCSKDIIQKVHDISEKAGFSIRDIMEMFLQRGIETMTDFMVLLSLKGRRELTPS